MSEHSQGRASARLPSSTKQQPFGETWGLLRVLAHLLVALAFSVALHLTASLRLDATTSEAWAQLLAEGGGVPAQPGLLFLWLLSVLEKSQDAGIQVFRLPSLVFFCLIVLTVAMAAFFSAGRTAAIRGVWLGCAIPLLHLSGLLSNPFVIVGLCFSIAALMLVIMARQQRHPGELGAGALLTIIPSGLIGLIGLLSVLASFHGWLLTLSSVLAVLIVSTARPLWERVGMAAVIIAVPLLGCLAICMWQGDWRLFWPPAFVSPSLEAGHFELASRVRLPLLLPLLLLGIGPAILWVSLRWASWAARPSKAPPRRLAKALLAHGGVPLLVLLFLSLFRPMDPLAFTTVLPPVIVGLSSWKGAGAWIQPIRATSVLLIGVLALVLTGVLSVAPPKRDPVARLSGWEDAGKSIEVWCSTVPEDEGARLLAEPWLAAHLRLVARLCEPIGLVDGPQGSWRSSLSVDGLVLVVHVADEDPPVVSGCKMGPHGAPVGPDHLSLVLRPARCEETSKQ